jgi:hypothetical protein
MKFVPNIFLKKVFIVLVFLSPTLGSANVALITNPPPPPGPVPPPPFPIDSGVFALFIIAALFGLHKIYQMNVKKARS